MTAPNTALALLFLSLTFLTVLLVFGGWKLTRPVRPCDYTVHPVLFFFFFFGGKAFSGFAPDNGHSTHLRQAN